MDKNCSAFVYMKIKPLISLILPVYNAEVTLSKCLDSILDQSYKNYELLIVDDGSTDASLIISKRYSERDYRIKVIATTNGGASSARNYGLENAKGEWIAFIDADDTVSDEWLELYVKNIHDVDFVVQKMIPVGNHIDTDRTLQLDFCGVIRDGVPKMFNTYMFGSVCNKLFNAKIIHDHNIRFKNVIKFREDEVFVMEYCCHADRVRVIPQGGYYYMVPDMIRKYGEINHFYALSELYARVLDLEIPFTEHIHESYLREFTNALFDSYRQKESDTLYKLKKYINIVGKDFKNLQNLSYLTKIAFVFPPRIADVFFSIKAKY